MPLQATSGAASYDAFGGGAAAVPQYIEDVFSTYLYTGTGVARTITNGIDLSTKGGLVWTKRRSTADYHALFDTARTINYALYTNTTSAQTLESNSMTSYGTSGYSIGTGPALNSNTNTFVSWTFRKQPKFFDVVTYTGNGTSQNIAHNLGSVPGCIIVKGTTNTFSWYVYHRSLTNNDILTLNSTDAAANAGSAAWNSTTPTSTQFSVGNGAGLNQNGQTYVAYLFAHNAGGFGLTGTDNVISCGSYTGNGSATGPVVTLGYEPQWVLIKNTTAAANWQLFDNMRGLAVGGVDARLVPNLTSAEDTLQVMNLTATGFDITTTSANINSSGATYIYIAIRRGPMKVPTSGTSVFSPISASNAQGTQNTTGFPVDLQMQTFRGGVSDHYVVDRLRGVSTNATNTEKYLVTNTTAAEASNTILTQYWNNTGFQTASGWASASTIYWNFGRAPNFFDEVCYTGTGSARTINHNLGVAPELMIVKSRSGANGWEVYSQSLPTNQFLELNNTGGPYTATTVWNNTAPTASVFSVGTDGGVNGSAVTYVAYLFATCAGVSKVGSYTGTGTTQQINCGFTGGARFVLIRRANSTGDWYVWDSARGIVAGNDPYLLLNSTAAEVTSTDYIDTYSAGFEISSTAPAAINASGGTFIFLAIA